MIILKLKMREIKFFAGLGTVFVFIGIFCFKAAFQKQAPNPHTTIKKTNKGLLVFFGTLSILIGIASIVIAVKKVS
jgi:hypothetical protein